LRLSSIGGYGLALVVFGAYDSFPRISTGNFNAGAIDSKNAFNGVEFNPRKKA